VPVGDYVCVVSREAEILFAEESAEGVSMNDFFRSIAQKASNLCGSAWAFMLAILSVLLWALAGPLFHFSDTWQLVINTWTNVATFLMVFVIQSSQNRESKATQLKLDELIRSQVGARNALIDLEDLSESDLAKLETQFRRLRERSGHTAGVSAVPPDAPPAGSKKRP
jgi:low affinity Fe/Cu permease